MSLEARTLSGESVQFSDERVDELRMMFRGPLLSPTDEGYDESRAVENVHIDRRPGLIVRCTGAADVIDAIHLAREHRLLVAVRAGGHHVAGHSVCEGGLVIDLRDMRGVAVDPVRRRVHVQAGATWGDVDREAQAFGLAVPGGVVSTTGVAGLTLGGGLGWLHRKWGLSCDSLVSADVVTAQGELVHASAKHNSDLFWGLRGGGGNFGIVVRFEFEAHSLGPTVMAAAAMYPASAAPKLMPKWRNWAFEAPDTITTRCMFWTMPKADALPPAVHDQDVFILGAVYAGDSDEGEKLTQPIRHADLALADLSGQMPFRFFQAAFDPLLKGLRSYWKSTYLKRLDDSAIDLICERGLNRPDPKVLVHVPLMGGAVSRIAARDTAFGDRSAQWMLSADGNWTDPSKAETVTEWVRTFIAEANKLPGAGGTYLNFSGDATTDQEMVRRQYGKNLQRLVALKHKYDPDNLFRMNNNIRPE